MKMTISINDEFGYIKIDKEGMEDLFDNYEYLKSLIEFLNQMTNYYGVRPDLEVE